MTRKKTKGYSGERRRFIEWLEEVRYQAVLSNYDGDITKAKYLPLVKSGADGAYFIEVDHKAETVDDGYAYMMTGILAGMETCKFCEDAREVIRTALLGYDMLYPTGEDCRVCEGKGKVNREILRGIVKADLAFDLNSLDNSWFYVSADSIFARPVAVCFGLFDIAAMLPSFIKVMIGEGDGGDKAAVIGAKKALLDIWKYFKTNKPKKVSIEKMFESLISGEPLYGTIWGSFCEYQGQELLSEEDFTMMAGDDIEYADMEEAMAGYVCPDWDTMSEIAGTLVRSALSSGELNKDMRNGYIFFMSNIRKCIEENKGLSQTAFPLISTMIYLMSGIKRLGNPFYYNGEKTERTVHYYELLNAMMSQDVGLDENALFQLLNPLHPQCSIISQQITSATSLLLCAEAFFGISFLPATAGIRKVKGIDNPGDRMEGIFSGMADLLNAIGLITFSPVYADIREKSYHDLVASIIDNLTIAAFGEGIEGDSKPGEA